MMYRRAGTGGNGVKNLNAWSGSTENISSEKQVFNLTTTAKQEGNSFEYYMCPMLKMCAIHKVIFYSCGKINQILLVISN